MIQKQLSCHIQKITRKVLFCSCAFKAEDTETEAAGAIKGIRSIRFGAITIFVILTLYTNIVDHSLQSRNINMNVNTEGLQQDAKQLFVVEHEGQIRFCQKTSETGGTAKKIEF